MNPQEYFTDLSAQLCAVQNRVRQLIGAAHWPSDGAWKESALRSVIRGYLPSSVSVGNGFILTPDGPSSQIDILIYDDSAPVLFRDGDFVVTTPDSVRAVIEVKTSVSRATLATALRKLSEISKLCRRRCMGQPPFVGLFSYNPTDCEPDEVLAALKDASGSLGSYVIAALAFGSSQFYRYWYFHPGRGSGQPHDSWHAYNLPNQAPGYFIHNVVEHLYPHAIERAESIWYPVDGKEPHCVAQVSRRDPETPNTSEPIGTAPSCSS